jgi:hypothetical protein
MQNGPLMTLRTSETIVLISFSLSLCLLPSLNSHMSSSPLPQWHSPTKLFQGRIFCRRNGFIHFFNNIPGIGIFIGSFPFLGLVLYMAFLSPHGPVSLSSSKWSIPMDHASSSPTSDEAPSSPSDVLSLEQIRDIVATTRGFFSRDYSLSLGWNNVSIRDALIRVELMIPKKMQYILDAALLQANLLNRTLVIPSFVYARACEYHTYVFFLFHISCGFMAIHRRAQ